MLLEYVGPSFSSGISAISPRHVGDHITDGSRDNVWTIERDPMAAAGGHHVPAPPRARCQAGVARTLLRISAQLS